MCQSFALCSPRRPPVVSPGVYDGRGGVPLTYAGDYLNSHTFRSFEIYFTLALLYLAIVWLIKGVAFLIENQVFEFAKYRR